MESSIKLDQVQARAVFSDSNTVVAAGAGSGKTSVLAERYLRLILENKAGVENILTLTFTRKAAAEMFERIYNLLVAHSQVPAVKKELANFDRAHISTLDSFSSQIVRSNSQKYGIPGDFSMDEARAAELAQEVALQFILEHHTNPALKQLIRDHGFEAVWKEFFSSLGLSYLSLSGPIDFTAMFDRQFKFLKKESTAKLKSALKWIGTINGLDPAASPSIHKAQSALAKLQDLEALFQQEQYEQIVAALDAVTLKKPGAVKKPELVVLKEAVGQVKPLLDQLWELSLTLMHGDTLKELFVLCQEFQTVYLEEKRNKVVLTFHDVSRMAVDILKENRELREFYKQQFRYIMIDEFQDNNLLQKELLYLLAEKKNLFLDSPRVEDLEPDKLFFVGDEKQSIYRFREADVSVFKGLSRELLSTGGQSLHLKTNYRSEPELIDFFNRLFVTVMENQGEAYEANFEALGSAAREEPVPPHIRIFYKPHNPEADQDSAPPDEAEAFFIGRYIQELVEGERLPIREQETTRPARYEDIVLLMRSTSNQIKYERVFRQLGIPYTTQSVRSLFLEAPLNDIYNVLQLAVYPGDRISYSAFLRSPFVNVSDAALTLLLSHTAPPFEDLDNLKINHRGDQAKLVKGREIYEFVKENADNIPLHELVFHLWYSFGYRYTLLKDARYHGYLEYYDYLEKLAIQADNGGKGLVEFLDFLRPNLGKYERIAELEIMKSRVEGVQLMTIHKSKGLEFPVVFLVNTGNMGRASGIGKSVYYIADEFGLTINIGAESRRKKKKKNYFYTRGEEENRKKEIAELKRLLYVASTRAKNHLIIAGCHNRQNQNSKNVMLNMILKALGWENAAGLSPLETPGIPSVQAIPDITQEQLRRLHKDSDSSAPGNLAELYEKSVPVVYSCAGREFAVTEWEEEPLSLEVTESLPALSSDAVLEKRGLEATFGTLCHWIIQKRLEEGQPPAAPPLTLVHAIPEEQLPLLMADALKLADRFFDSKLGQLVSHSAKVESELPFIYLYNLGEEKRFLNGKMDLYFELGAEAFVVDFKTDKMIKKGDHGFQMEIYRRAAQEWTRKLVRVFLFYLRNGKAVEVNEKVI